MQRLKAEYQRKEDRGTLTQVNTGEWKQLNILEIKKGNTFGGHYHKEKEELFYIVFGKVEFIIENEQGTFTESLGKGDCFLVEPYDTHTICALQDTIIVEVLSHPYSKEDTYENL
jgi:mannose-6-phosphate isomerase-like protein (cupin superfamily)